MIHPPIEHVSQLAYPAPSLSGNGYNWRQRCLAAWIAAAQHEQLDIQYHERANPHRDLDPRGTHCGMVTIHGTDYDIHLAHDEPRTTIWTQWTVVENPDTGTATSLPTRGQPRLLLAPYIYAQSRSEDDEELGEHVWTAVAAAAEPITLDARLGAIVGRCVRAAIHADRLHRAS